MNSKLIAIIAVVAIFVIAFITFIRSFIIWSVITLNVFIVI